ncbi:DUF2306 domain-containing protein [Aquimarina litoralis]|uniref:DUF2306 domain-containing protein n=1 Tax=Aquimarina litoralis TaxID=584605 RepID=UPI001C59CC95|nr:DUF2306 domain-containing protein [Aquimarina litoralis]MBW1295223.1 DUF2306 domain-containing protein [Aquimarina litoralis]
MNTTYAKENKTIKSQKILVLVSQFWFVIAVLGQWIFAYYVTTFYGTAAMDGDFQKWNEVLPHGYTEGATISNIVVGIHLLFAVIIIIGGPLQFIDKIRTKARSFHRWNGKIYIVTTFIAGFSGIYMILSKGAVTGWIGDVSVSFNGVLMMIFAVLAWRTALQKKFLVHKRWVLRLFLAVNGVWFFRIGLMLWLFIHGKPVGFDAETFRGPFITFLGFGQYVIPLMILETYFRVKDRKIALEQLSMSLFLFVATIATGVGIFAATMGLWLPRL